MKRMKLKTQKRNFFTLLEVSLSISILAIGMIGILSAFPAGVTAGKSAVESTKAMAIVDGVIAKLEDNINYVPAGNDWITALGLPQTGEAVENYSEYSVRFSRTDVSTEDPTFGNNELYFFDIFILYQDKTVCNFQTYIYVSD